MVHTLLALIKAILAIPSPRLVELAGAGAVTIGVTLTFGGGAGWIAAGTAALLKAWAADTDAARGEKTGSRQ